jgi:hypothetical protein
VIAPVATPGLSLDLVLLGSRLAFGTLEFVLLGVVALGWMVFGAWLWRTAARHDHDYLKAGLYFVSLASLFTTILAQDALLFYTGLAIASYTTVALLRLIHGPEQDRTVAAQTILLVLSDLMLFELFVSLYALAQTADFSDLQTVYQAHGSGASFLGVLLIASGGCRVATVLLLVPLSGRLHPWKPGAATALLCTGLLPGLLIIARFIDSSLSGPQAFYTLLAMLSAAWAGYLLAILCVLKKVAIDRMSCRVATMASSIVHLGRQSLAGLGRGSRRLAPQFRAAEQKLLSWPLAVATAVTFAGLFALTALL